MEVKKKLSTLKDQPGPCGAGPASTLPSAFLAVSFWGTSGQHVAPITILKACARLFLSTGWLGAGVVSF